MAGLVERRDRVGSLTKGLGVIEILAAEPSGLSLSQVAHRTGLTRAGARRLLLTLVDSGWAHQDGRTFTLSPRPLTIARSWLNSQSIWNFALGPMRELSALLRESCSAGVLSGEDIVYVARVPGERITSVALHVGTRLPAYCTAMGRVLLAGLGSSERASLLDRMKLEKRTPKSVSDRAGLEAVIDRAADDGYALIDEELELGLRSIAVPLRDRLGRTVAAVNISTPSARHSVSEMESAILPELRKAATRIEEWFVLD